MSENIVNMVMFMLPDGTEEVETILQRGVVLQQDLGHPFRQRTSFITGVMVMALAIVLNGANEARQETNIWSVRRWEMKNDE